MILSQLWDRIIKGSATMSEREFLRVQLRNFLASEQRKTMVTAIDYYNGNHDILTKQRYVVGEGGKQLALQGVPNNQIVDNRFDDLVDQKVNYLLSKPLDINVDDDELDKLFGIQFQRLLKSVGKFATMAGKAYIHPYIGVDGSLKFKMMKPHQVLPFWADEEHTQLDAFLYLYDIEYYTGLETKTIHKVEYYTPNGIQYYIWDMEQLIPDADKTNTANFAIDDKPYNWEGKEYTSVDISNMENLKGIDLIESLDNGNGLSTSVNGEYNLKTIMSLVSKATGIPVEFFEYLPIKEVIKIKYKAISFL